MGVPSIVFSGHDGGAAARIQFDDRAVYPCADRKMGLDHACRCRPILRLCGPPVSHVVAEAQGQRGARAQERRALTDVRGGAGVCRTDLHVIEGIWRAKADVKLPYTMGRFQRTGWLRLRERAMD